MNQKEFWNQKWKNITKKLPATDFARKTWNFLKDKGKKSILEIGCGDGKDSIFFASKGFDITAIDFSLEAIFRLEKEKKKQNLKNITTQTIDIGNIDFPKNNFDVIYSNLSLHYFDHKDTIKIFEKLYKILKKNGYLFVKCKSKKDPFCIKGKKIEDNLWLVGDKKYNFFDKNYIKTIIGQFEVINIEETSSKILTMDNGIIKSHFIEAIATKK